MTARADEGDVAFSLAHGGLAHDLLRRLGLVRGDAHDTLRQIVALVAIGWLVMMALATVEALLGQPTALVHELSVHVRLLVGLPLLVVASAVLNDRCRHPLDQLAHSQPGPVRTELVRILERATRMRDAWWPELVLLATALALSISLWSMSGSAGVVGLHPAAPDISATHGWYALVGLPLFLFLLARTGRLWILWGWISWQVSRLPLLVIATHPDRAGGLGHLARPIAGIAIAAVADAAVVSSAWAGALIDQRAALSDYGPPLAALLILHVIVALAPSFFFTRHLIQGRIEGLHVYGRFAHRYVDAFQRRWIVNGDRSEKLLGTSDIQSLADLGNSFDVVEQMRVVPFGRPAVSMVVLATLIPMLPLAFTEMSTQQVVSALGRALAGGRLH